MSRRVVALTGSMSAEQESAFRDFITGRGWGFWHWLSGAWLIEIHNDEANPCTLIRDQIVEITTNVHTFVFEVSDVSPQWAGFGPQSESSNMFKWLETNWIPPRPDA